MVTFKIFSDYTEAQEIFNVLNEHKLHVELEDNSERFNPSFTSTPFSKQYRIKIEPADFASATSIIRAFLRKEIASVESDYYLVEFTDAELKEILVKPDEWSFFDYFLAEKLLQEKGVEVQSDEITREKEERLEELAKPEKRAILMVVLGYIFSLASGFFGLLFGYLLFHSKKTLYTGEVVYSYQEPDRLHGKIMFAISILSLTIFTLRYLLIL